MQKFYLDNVIDLIKADERESEKDAENSIRVDEKEIRLLKKKYKSSMTQLRFIENSIGRLRDFHDIEEPTEKELRAFSFRAATFALRRIYWRQQGR